MDRHTTRRSVVAALGASLALAGCSTGDQTGSPERESTVEEPSEYPVVRHAMGETVTTDSGASVTVANPRVRTSVVVDQHTSPVNMAADIQWLVVDVRVRNGDDETKYMGGQFRALTDGTPADGGSAPLRSEFHGTDGGQPVGVSVAATPADSGQVAWVRGLPRSVLWSVPDRIVERLGTGPQFSVEGVSVTAGDEPVLTLTVRNDGDRDGTLYVNVSGSKVQDGNEIVAVQVPHGETVTKRARPSILVPEDETTRVTVNWGSDEVVRTVGTAAGTPSTATDR
jgi:hypothetical protein